MRFKNFNIAAFGFLGALTSHAAVAQNQQIELIVPVELDAQSTSSKKKLAVLQQFGKSDAAAVAWSNIRSRPDVRGKISRLNENDELAIEQFLERACAFGLIGSDADDKIAKKRRQVTARYRVTCDQRDIQDFIKSLVGPGLPTDKLVTFFLVKEVRDRTEYDANIVRSRGTTQNINASGQVSSSSSYSNDDRVKNQTRETFGERRGRVDDSYQAREQSKGQSSSSASFDASASVDRQTDERSNGQITRTTMTQTYRNASPEEFNASLANVFSSEGVKIYNYADVVAFCDLGNVSPDPDGLAREYGDKEGELPSAVRTEIIKAVKQCGQEYLLIGWAEVDGSLTDPVTGAPRYSVNTRAKVYYLGDLIPEEIPVNPKAGAASNNNPNVARLNAVNQAAERVAEELIVRLIERGAT